MNSPLWARRLIPAALGAGMLAIVVVAALTPNIGIGSAQPACQYNCTTPQNNTLEYLLIGGLVALIVAALVGLLIFQRRKRRGPGGGAVAAWEQPPEGPTGPGISNDAAPVGDYGGVPPGGAASYDSAGAAAGAVGYEEATTPPEAGPEWAEAAAAPPLPRTVVPDESEPDIDRLMKELDQISNDILKKPAAKTAPPSEPTADEGDPGS